MSEFYELQENTNKEDLKQVLRKLINNWEHEIVEFKEATNDYDKNKIGYEYIFYYRKNKKNNSFEDFKYFTI